MDIARTFKSLAAQIIDHGDKHFLCLTHCVQAVLGASASLFCQKDINFITIDTLHFGRKRGIPHSFTSFSPFFGMLAGIVSVLFSRTFAWHTRFLKPFVDVIIFDIARFFVFRKSDADAGMMVTKLWFVFLGFAAAVIG